MGLPSYLLDLLMNKRDANKAGKALNGLLPKLEMQGPTPNGAPNYGSNQNLVEQMQALREYSPQAALKGLIQGTSADAMNKRESDGMNKRLLGLQIDDAQTGLDQRKSGYVSPLDSARIENLNSQVAARDQVRGPTEMDTLQLEEQRLKTESQRQINDKRVVDADQAAKDLVNKSLSGAFEADAALNNIDELLEGDSYKDIYGTGDNYIPTVFPSSVTLEAKRDQVVSLLGLESRQKLKGQGTITDSESQQLAASATILGTAGITEDAAKAELNRVKGIFEMAKDRALDNPEAYERYSSESGIDDLYSRIQSEEITINDLTAKQRIELKKFIKRRSSGVK